MEQVAWTSLGVLAAGMFGSFFYLASKIDALQASLIARMDASDDSLSGRIDSLSGRIDALGARLDARIDSLGGLLQAHIERHAG